MKKFLDENGLLYLWNKIKGLFTGYAKTEDLPDVSGLAKQEDLTTHTKDTTVHITAEERTKWNSKADASAIPDVSSFITEETLNSKGYATETFVTGQNYQNSTQVQEAINKAVGGITGIDFSIVEDTLPETGKKGTIYLKSNSGTDQNIYDEYIWLGENYEKIGTTDVDLSGYLKSAELVAISNEEIDTIVTPK